MPNQLLKNIGYVALTFFIASILSVIPLSSYLAWLRPNWLLLVLIFWLLVWPLNIGIGTAFFIGLLADILEGTLLGHHALAYIISAYLLVGGYHRMRMYTVWQQIPIIFFLMFVVQFVNIMVAQVIGEVMQWYILLLPALTSALIWPALNSVLNWFKQTFIVIEDN